MIYLIWHAYKCFVGPKQQGYSWRWRLNHARMQYLTTPIWSVKALWLLQRGKSEAAAELTAEVAKYEENFDS